MADWKKTAELVFDTVSDAWQLVILTVIPTPASSTNSNEKMRALHLSALVTITILAIWLATTTRTGVAQKFDALVFIILAIFYFTFSSWVIFGLLKLTSEYEPRGDTITDSLALVIGFNLLAVFAATCIVQADVFIGFNISNAKLHSLALWAAVTAAAIITFGRTILLARTRSASSLLKATLIVCTLAILAGFFLYELIYSA